MDVNCVKVFSHSRVRIGALVYVSDCLGEVRLVNGGRRVNPRERTREVSGRDVAASTGILSRPQRREITTALTFRLRSQRRESR